MNSAIMKRPTVSQILIFVISHGVMGLVIPEVVAVVRNTPIDTGDRLLALAIVYVVGGYINYREPDNFLEYASKVEGLFRNKPQNHS
jgi:hypothetical protein